MAPTTQARAIKELQFTIVEMRHPLAAQMAPPALQPPMALQAPQVPQAPQAQQTPPAHHMAPVLPVIEQFYQYLPPTFDKGNVPLTVDKWLRKIEKLFLRNFFGTSLIRKFRRFFARGSCWLFE
ncbi:Uncharacterized protein Adt_23077 [Abeliophyllum distichum]|uniref:Uncharacterized protein n=1 Tax=Abeliophyllum distichum TaxID=126358 RepID=A0ABD1SCV8_9LAMI